MRLIIVSGLSGSGKTIALQTLEDKQFYCVDNLPLHLLRPLVETMLAHETALDYGLAVGIDVRNFLDQLDDFPAVLAELRTLDLDIDVLFLQASDDVLVRRYNETRRKHPLSAKDDSLTEAIQRERLLLQAISSHASLLIDSSHTNVHELRKLVGMRLQATSADHLVILFESFGYKHGVPTDADFVFDVRFLPNPHWDKALRPHTGLDQPVIDFLTAQDSVQALLVDLRDVLARWIPQFEQGTRSYLTIAIGCTGGQHRSVFIASQLAKHFKASQRHVIIRHRELRT